HQRLLGRPEEALVVTGQALRNPAALMPVWAARVRALQAIIQTQVGDGHPAEAEAIARQAEADGERAGDTLAIGYALHAMSLVYIHYGRDIRAGLQVIDRGLAVLGDDPEATDLRLLLLGNRAWVLGNLGRL